VLNIELLLRSRLVKEALSSVLTAAGFCVLHERDGHDEPLIVITEIDDFKDLEAHRLGGDSIVLLASDSHALDLDDDQIAALSGILTYGLSADAFVQSLRLIGAGERVFPRGLGPRPKLATPSSGSGARSDGNRLSPREREVLSHLLAGHANKVIARHLGTSEATVKVHLKNLLRKINVDNRTQAAIWAVSNLPELKPSPSSFA
jgi:two-component system, NarL family, nitrate/nitrite response regulator NarL